MAESKRPEPLDENTPFNPTLCRYDSCRAARSCFYPSRCGITRDVMPQDESKHGVEQWHYWPRDNSVSIANREGVRLDFASHNAAILGKAVLEADHNEAASLRQRLEDIRAEWEDGADPKTMRRLLDDPIKP